MSIAVAIISKPQILFIDETTLCLDVFASKELWGIIKKLKGKITIILTSHYLEEIEHLCDRVSILSKGKVLKEGTIEVSDRLMYAFVVIINKCPKEILVEGGILHLFQK